MGKFKIWMEIEYQATPDVDPRTLHDFPEPAFECDTLEEAIEYVLAASDSPETSYLKEPHIVQSIRGIIEQLDKEAREGI